MSIVLHLQLFYRMERSYKECVEVIVVHVLLI